MKNYMKPVMNVNEFRAKETVASLEDWLTANGVKDDASKNLVALGAVSYYAVS